MYTYIYTHIWCSIWYIIFFWSHKDFTQKRTGERFFKGDKEICSPYTHVCSCPQQRSHPKKKCFNKKNDSPISPAPSKKNTHNKTKRKTPQIRISEQLGICLTPLNLFKSQNQTLPNQPTILDKNFGTSQLQKTVLVLQTILTSSWPGPGKVSESYEPGGYIKPSRKYGKMDLPQMESWGFRYEKN